MVPPVPQPSASYMVAKNCRPVGSLRVKVYELFVTLEGTVILRIRPESTVMVCDQRRPTRS